MKPRPFSVAVFFLAGFTILAQDSLKNTDLQPVVVTATRNERSLQALPMPVTLISGKILQTMGSLRLQDALTEQTGLIIVPQINAQGNGLQLQGMNPDYTLILIDGEPLIGRYTGSLELNRITVGNIRQIEVVKGPSSSLYGSDALAGVVNIITEPPSGNQGRISMRYGTNRTSDINGQGSIQIGNVSAYLFGDRYETAGYDLSPDRFGKTVSPFTNHTLQSRVNWKISDKTNFSLSSRMFSENQRFGFEVVSGAGTTRTFGTGKTGDWNINPTITHKFSPAWRVTARLYMTRYQTETKLNLESGGDLYYSDDFKQGFLRPEVTSHLSLNRKQFLTAGIGLIAEDVQTSRYGDEKVRKQQTRYAFLQHEWQPGNREKLQLITGLRLDDNSVYGRQLSPKLSASYSLNERLVLRASSGIGFKAPDFRQLYFNFTNSAAGGYSVLGSEVVAARLNELDQAGQIDAYFFNPASLSTIRAERSIAFNGGADVHLSQRLNLQFNLFRNSINNLIETQAVAVTTSGQNIYTYRNIRRAMTEGIEANGTYRLRPGIQVSGGYQFLLAMDRDVWGRVRSGKVYYRDPASLTTQQLRVWEYHGLYNRSRHNANMKLFWQNKKGQEASVRFIYRSRFGVGDIRGNIQGETVPPSDINGNAILDIYDRFVSGYVMVNLSAGFRIGESVKLLAGVDNLLNHREPVFIPNLPGRLFWLNLNWTLPQPKPTI